MRDGDRAGLAMLRDSSAWIGVKRDNGATRVVMVNGLTMDSNWNTTGTGTEAASADRLRRPDLAARQRRHPPRLRPPGTLLLQHRRRQLHPPRPRLHAEQRLAVLHGLPLRHLQLRHPGPRRRRHRAALRAGDRGRPRPVVTGEPPRPSERQYVCAEDAGAAPLVANRTAVGPWEQFDLVDLGGGPSRSAPGPTTSTSAPTTAAPPRSSPTAPGRRRLGDVQRVDNANGSISLRAQANEPLCHRRRRRSLPAHRRPARRSAPRSRSTSSLADLPQHKYGRAPASDSSAAPTSLRHRSRHVSPHESQALPGPLRRRVRPPVPPPARRPPRPPRAGASAAPARDGQARQDHDLRLWYPEPASEWLEALPIGNGRLGAMVFGGVDAEQLQLNEDTVWAGGPVRPGQPDGPGQPRGDQAPGLRGRLGRRAVADRQHASWAARSASCPTRRSGTCG